MPSSIGASSGIILLNMQMIADGLEELDLDFELRVDSDRPCLRRYLVYCGQKQLSPDTLYIIPEGCGDGFPTDDYDYLSIAHLSGKAPHISGINLSLSQVLNEIIAIFQSYQDLELKLSHILTDGGSLTDLCRVGSEFFHNPIYIHDDMFTVIALSSRVEGMLKFERNENSGNLYIPLSLIDDFKFDPNYAQTMELHHAGLWDNEQFPYNIRSLFLNLWDGQRYCGRLLVNELQSSLLPSQSQTIEYLGMYALMLMRNRTNQNNLFQNFEDTLISLLSGAAVDRRDLRTMLSILDWHESDRYLCLKFENQDPRASIRSDSALNSHLSSIFSSFSSFYYQGRLCIVINVTQTDATGDMVRQELAPYVRDSCMYAGISSPVDGIYNVRYAFRQTDIVLDYITHEDSIQWILPFPSCAMSYIRSCATQELPPKALASPLLKELMEYDMQYGTQYYETLRTYLLCERSIPKTADALIIHRTTLTYRLHKISELVHMNLDDSNQRQYLLFSFYILDMERDQAAAVVRTTLE